MAYFCLAALTIIALATVIAAERVSEIRAWVDRDPFDLDAADAHAHGRCARPGCRIDHEAFWGAR